MPRRRTAVTLPRLAASPEQAARIARARRLALLADCELQHGHHAYAEYLERLAEKLRRPEARA